VDRDLRGTAAQGHHGQDLRHHGLGRQARQPDPAAAGGQAGGHAGRPGRADGARSRCSGAARDPASADSDSNPAGRDRAARGDGRATPCARAAQRDGTAAAAEREAQHGALEADGGHQWEDRRERRALATDLALEVRAAGTTVDVPAQDAAPGNAAGDRGELLADLDARGRARWTDTQRLRAIV
jgi:hypothetical protein